MRIPSPPCRFSNENETSRFRVRRPFIGEEIAVVNVTGTNNGNERNGKQDAHKSNAYNRFGRTDETGPFTAAEYRRGSQLRRGPYDENIRRKSIGGAESCVSVLLGRCHGYNNRLFSRTISGKRTFYVMYRGPVSSSRIMSNRALSYTGRVRSCSSIRRHPVNKTVATRGVPATAFGNIRDTRP